MTLRRSPVSVTIFIPKAFFPIVCPLFISNFPFKTIKITIEKILKSKV
ncbi:hypothetical protein BTHERMOSOX_1966 [Bathymodiolus thermophilus thioautotrophic gill symbiont]|nr:hypothetical protein BTHERMOSOX_1966 [Bathymodiolus thermophilus thioautotrophic gill symbiont]